MNNSERKQTIQLSDKSGTIPYMIGFAVILSILCCALILLIPTQSINVDTVYQGF
jgi:hypothetical protein